MNSPPRRNVLAVRASRGRSRANRGNAVACGFGRLAYTNVTHLDSCPDDAVQSSKEVLSADIGVYSPTAVASDRRARIARDHIQGSSALQSVASFREDAISGRIRQTFEIWLSVRGARELKYVPSFRG